MLAGDPVKAAAVLRQAIEVDILGRRQEVRETARMVLVIDQFEQLFTLQPGSAGGKARACCRCCRRRWGRRGTPGKETGCPAEGTHGPAGSAKRSGTGPMRFTTRCRRRSRR